ncbi:MAG: hypothetical protein QOH46_3771, partial [Solirubrobacteraceae bacterium]|nr:hypothetical protein [Solirubrobacteraceae bacterium]
MRIDEFVAKVRRRTGLDARALALSDAPLRALTA